MHIKLTENVYIAAEIIEIVQLCERYGQPCVEVVSKRRDLCELKFLGEEANEAWANWKAHMRFMEENRRHQEK